MKSNSVWKFLVNPFTRIAGWQALLLGLVIAALSGAIGGMNRIWFDGVIDMHAGGDLPYWFGFVMLGIDLVCIILVMTVTAFSVSKSFRIIDIAGTMTLARAPMVILALIGLVLKIEPRSMADIMNGASMPLTTIVLAIISVPVIVWYIALMYNGYKVSCNISGPKLIISFVIGLIVAEALSKILIASIMGHAGIAV